MGKGGKGTFIGERVGVLDAACHSETCGQDCLGRWDVHFGLNLQEFYLIR